jgi:hypothetical protein
VAPNARKRDAAQLYFVCPRCSLAAEQERGQNGSTICPDCRKDGFNIHMQMLLSPVGPPRPS